MAADALVLAGGLGTRLRQVTGGLLPKVLVPVRGRPFVDYKLRSLAVMGVQRVTMLIGEGADQIIAHVGDGHQLGINVQYRADGPQLLGTAGAIRAAIDELPDTFWVTYGDSIGFGTLDHIESAVARAGVPAAMTVLENEDRWDRSNVAVDDDRVVVYSKNPPAGLYRWIDYGLLYFRRSLFESLPPNEPLDLRAVIDPLVRDRRLLAAPVTERFWEVGTPLALAEAERHFADVALWERLS